MGLGLDSLQNITLYYLLFMTLILCLLFDSIVWKACAWFLLVCINKEQIDKSILPLAYIRLQNGPPIRAFDSG